MKSSLFWLRTKCLKIFASEARFPSIGGHGGVRAFFRFCSKNVPTEVSGTFCRNLPGIWLNWRWRSLAGGFRTGSESLESLKRLCFRRKMRSDFNRRLEANEWTEESTNGGKERTRCCQFFPRCCECLQRFRHGSWYRGFIKKKLAITVAWSGTVVENYFPYPLPVSVIPGRPQLVSSISI